MTDLTEKWKSGELKEGYYYIKANRTISFVEIDYYHIFGETEYWNGNDNEDVLEVLAPVPTFEELQELKQKIHILTESQMKLENTIGELGQENASLKELLKECVVIIGYADTISNNEENKKTIYELLTKIRKVLK